MGREQPDTQAACWSSAWPDSISFDCYYCKEDRDGLHSEPGHELQGTAPAEESCSESWEYLSGGLVYLILGCPSFLLWDKAFWSLQPQPALLSNKALQCSSLICDNACRPVQSPMLHVNGLYTDPQEGRCLMLSSDGPLPGPWPTSHGQLSCICCQQCWGGTEGLKKAGLKLWCGTAPIRPYGHWYLSLCFIPNRPFERYSPLVVVLRSFHLMSEETWGVWRVSVLFAAEKLALSELPAHLRLGK